MVLQHFKKLSQADPVRSFSIWSNLEWTSMRRKRWALYKNSQWKYLIWDLLQPVLEFFYTSACFLISTTCCGKRVPGDRTVLHTTWNGYQWEDQGGQGCFFLFCTITGKLSFLFGDWVFFCSQERNQECTQMTQDHFIFWNVVFFKKKTLIFPSPPIIPTEIDFFSGFNAIQEGSLLHSAAKEGSHESIITYLIQNGLDISMTSVGSCFFLNLFFLIPKFFLFSGLWTDHRPSLGCWEWAFYHSSSFDRQWCRCKCAGYHRPSLGCWEWAFYHSSSFDRQWCRCKCAGYGGFGLSLIFHDTKITRGFIPISSVSECHWSLSTINDYWIHITAW